MGRSHVSFMNAARRIVFVMWVLMAPLRAWSQAPPQSRIVEKVDENVLVTLRGNTHPLAQRQFDRGAAPADLPMARMLLVLKRSASQGAALEKLLDDQQDQSSPSYHQWLTADAFGQKFGPSDQDVQTVAAWLGAHGFQIGMLGRGRTVIEFSGTAAQVQQAFHTEIHKYTVNGEDHWANASDPQIPAALAPVVVGVASLHNFPKRPMNRVAGKFMKDRATGVVTPLGTEFTTVDSSICPGAGNCYFVGPYDFAAIYNVLPLWNLATPIDGTGQSIAIADESNINVQDVRDFRNLFGLPANDPQVIVDGADPGIVPGFETESLLDVEWAGAVAKGATIKLVVSAPTNSTEGADLAAVYAIENNLAPIVSESFGDCELDLGDAGNSFENLIREQAAAEGITFITASGDQGSATCDGFSGTTPEPATFGLAVSGLASSPYGVAVGGTDFLNFGSSYNFKSPSPYWSPTNDANEASALGYVPETTWNDSCTNNLFVVLGAGGTPEASCNNSLLLAGVITAGGGGGKSTCTTSTGTSPSNCVSGYAKPSWQAAPGVPADSARDIPDISLFSADGLMTSAYIICEADMPPGHGSCNLNQPTYSFVAIGGTSGSAPAFAGIVALVNQSTGASGQGNANYVLYKLASSSPQTSQNCNATGSPSAGCIFYDITNGTIAMPCARSSPNCNFSNSSDTFGVLSGYSAGTGYDLATGLGSVNASNLVHNWIGPATSSTTTLSLTSQSGISPISITHGQSVNFAIDVAPSAATGSVSLVGLPGGTGTASVPMASFPLQNGAASGTTAALTGGTSYAVTAHYSGDGTYKPSDSAPITVTVASEPSTTLITIPVFDPNTGNETANTPSSIVYGTPTAVRVDVGNASAKTTFPSQLVCAPLTCPTGNITLSDSVNGASATLLSPSGGFPLGSGGYVLDYNAGVLPGGTHQLSASYPGDSSYKSSAGTYALTVTPAPMQISNFFVPAGAIVGTSVNMYATFNAVSSFPGAGPTGTIAFYDGAAQIPGTVTYSSSQPGSANFPASLTGFLNATFTTVGSHQITAKYSGDPNYGAATSGAMAVSLLYSTLESGTANPTTVNLGQTVNLTATVTGASTTPPMTGTFQFFLSNGVIPSGMVTQGTDANGNQTLTAVVTATPQFSQGVTANYSGDANYTSNSTNIFVGVNIPDFSLSSPSSPLLITAGMPGSVPITVAPLSNVASAVSVSCQGNLPVGYTCSLSPATVNLSNGVNGTTTLSLNPNAPAVSGMSLRESIVTLAAGVLSVPGNVKRGSLVVGFALLLLLLWPARCLRRRWKVGLATVSALCFIVGCGGSSSTGGGPAIPLPTTTTVMSSASKVASQASVTFTATITGSASSAPTGSVIFQLNGGFVGSAALVGNSATLMTQIPAPGIYALSAQYSGDALNLSSTATAQSVLVTGSTVMTIQGQTSNLTHFANVTVTLQ